MMAHDGHRLQKWNHFESDLSILQATIWLLIIVLDVIS